MKKYIPVIMIVLIALCSLGIVLLHRKTENEKLAKYEQIREDCKMEISNIHDMESEDYINKIDVTLNYNMEDAYPGAKDKVFDDNATFIVRLDESFGKMNVRGRVLELIKYDEEIHADIEKYLKQAGYYSFMKKNEIRDEYFEVNGVKYYTENYFNIEYYCGSDEYVLFTYSMNIENHRTGNKEKYTFSYEDGKLERFEKFELPKKKDTMKTTESSKSVTRKVPQRNHQAKRQQRNPMIRMIMI